MKNKKNLEYYTLVVQKEGYTSGIMYDTFNEVLKDENLTEANFHKILSLEKYNNNDGTYFSFDLEKLLKVIKNNNTNLLNELKEKTKNAKILKAKQLQIALESYEIPKEYLEQMHEAAAKGLYSTRLTVPEKDYGLLTLKLKEIGISCGVVACVNQLCCFNISWGQ